jgi:hypothetical protein
MTVEFYIRPDNRLACKFAYNEHVKDRLKSELGARYNPDDKSWHVQGSPSIIPAVLAIFDGYTIDPDQAAAGLMARADTQAAAQVHKETSGDQLAEIPGKLPAWEHQKQAYHWAAPRIGALFGIDMGGGKSRLGVSLSEGAWMPKAGVVILSPRSVVKVWPNQFNIHGTLPWATIVGNPKKPVKDRVAQIRKDLARADAMQEMWAVIVNYDAAWRSPMKELLLELADKGIVLILDESHRVKAPGGKASMFCGTLGEHTRAAGGRVAGKTGTPMPHGPEDIYAQGRAIDPGVFGTSFSRFKNRYCVMGGYENRQIVAYQRQDEFAAKLSELGFFWDAPLADVPPVDVVIPFALDPKSAKAYATLEQDFILGIKDGTVTPKNALVKLLRLQQITGGFVGDDDGDIHELGTEKIDAFKDWLEDYPANRPLVVFARFKEDMRRLGVAIREAGRSVGFVSGSVKEGHPDYGLNQHSQMRDDLDVAVLQLQSGGVGIDLTRASTSVYFSLDFNLGNYLQSRKRTDRPGQTEHVTYVHFVAENTKDEDVYAALEARQDVVAAIINQAKGLAAPPPQDEAPMPWEPEFDADAEATGTDHWPDGRPGEPSDEERWRASTPAGPVYES